jgi:adenine-specific DNA-methyltransferase
VKYHQLVPQKDLSVLVSPSVGGGGISLHDNLIIQGDNLKALKALLPTYTGKIKCICLDPSYNTDEEGWVYGDNVNSPMSQEWFKSEVPVDKEDLTRHNKWLCMMMPKIKTFKRINV